MSKWQPIETAPKDGQEIIVRMREQEYRRTQHLIVFFDEYHGWSTGEHPVWDASIEAWAPIPRANDDRTDWKESKGSIVN